MIIAVLIYSRSSKYEIFHIYFTSNYNCVAVVSTIFFTYTLFGKSLAVYKIFTIENEWSLPIWMVPSRP